MINDEYRHKVANNLRADAVNDKLKEQLSVEEIIAGRIGETMYDEWGNVRVLEILTKLANLIDRPVNFSHPTCQLVNLWDESREKHLVTCTNCHFGEKAINNDDFKTWLFARKLWLRGDYIEFKCCPICGALLVNS